MLHFLQMFKWSYCLFLSYTEHFLSLSRQAFPAVFRLFQHIIPALVFVYLIQDTEMSLIFRTYTLLELKSKEQSTIPVTII